MNLMTSFAVIVPTLNEIENLETLKGHVREFDEIIFVDGNSSDGTQSYIIQNYPTAKLLFQGKLKGKGSAIVLGLLAAQSEYAVLLDADKPISKEELVTAMSFCKENPGIDLVKGSRHLLGGGSEDLTRIREIGAKAFALIARLLFKVNWTEVCYGFWILRTDQVKKMGLSELIDSPKIFLNFKKVPYGHSFEFDQVLFLKSLKMNLKIQEIPSFELARNFGPSKLSALKDGLRTLLVLLIERFTK